MYIEQCFPNSGPEIFCFGPQEKILQFLPIKNEKVGPGIYIFQSYFHISGIKMI